jgi:two-component system sensor histidine kinase UhpB
MEVKDGSKESPRLSLFWRVFLTNAAVLLVGWGVLAFSPATLKSPLALWEGGALGVAGLGVMLVVNLLLLRRVFSPLSRLTALMRRADPLRPGPRIPVYGQDAEVVELTKAFNEMLERLEAERRESATRALNAQEAERRRLARELHDEIGQRLTAVLLHLEHSSRRVPGGVADELLETRETARASLEELRRIVARLRPVALEDLGLLSALIELSDRLTSDSSARVVRRLDGDLPELSPDAELVIYRVAQEGLTNVVRHAGASKVELRLERSERGVRLKVVDDGRGLDGASEGGGIRGMRERALLIGARLDIGRSEMGGVEVSLDVAALSERS